MAQKDGISQVDFTDNALESFYSAVDDPYFRDKDLFLIYDALKNQMRLVPFGDYLKRYIYSRAELTGEYQDIPLSDYQAIIRDAFAERGTPVSFTPTTARLSAMAKNWLTQQTVKRSVVLLLGFGLGMNVADVNEFLTKALREQMLNPKDPMEAICWYCYKNGYGYARFAKLWQAFEALPPDDEAPEDLFSEQTANVRASLRGLTSDEALMAFLRKLKRPGGEARQSVAAREAFNALYDRAREIAAGMLNEAEAEDRALLARRLQEKLSGSERMFEYEKKEKVENYRAERRTVKPEDIKPGDIERIICSAVPVGDHGNLMPAKASELSEQFSGKRFNRQHVSEVLAGRAGIDRFDLITLNFFVFAGNLAAHLHVRRRYSSFIESTNRILDQCGMGPLYIANPYECFILMCLLSEDPLGTYADVLEISYQAAAEKR